MNFKEKIINDPILMISYFNINDKSKIEFKDLIAINKNINLLDNIPIKDIREEFNNVLLNSNNILFALEYMQECGVLQKIIPEWECIKGFEQKNKHHLYTADIHTFKAIEAVKPDLITRLALLLHDISKPNCFTIGEDGEGHFYGHEKKSSEISKTILKRLEYDEKTIERVSKLIRYHLFYKSNIDVHYAKKLLNRFGEEDVYRFFRIIEADRIAHKPPYDFEPIDKLKLLVNNIINETPELTIKDLDISGNDLIKKFNLSQGPIIGKILNYLLQAVISDNKLNNKDILFKLTQNYIWRQRINNSYGERLYEYIKHYKFKCGMSWESCSRILEEDYGIIISAQTLKNKIKNYMIYNCVDIKKVVKNEF